jgi:predicted permease
VGVSWLSRFFHRGTADADLDEEIRFHLDQEVQLRAGRGEPPYQARQGARRDFGNVIVVMETTRQMWGWTPMALFDDLQHAYRRLRSRPAMMLTAASMLALGVGLTTGMFTVIDALMLRPAPFRDADRLANLVMFTPNGGRTDVSPAVLEAWRATSAFAAAEGATTETSLIDTSTEPRVAASARVSPGIFAMLGTPPSRGRGFDPTDGRPGTDDRVLLSEDVWRSVFGADPNLVGQRVRIDGASMLVIGLMPSGFRFPEWNTVLWKPINFSAPPPTVSGEAPRPRAYVRVASGVPIDDALRMATVAARRVDSSIPAAAQATSQPLAGVALDPYYRRAVPLLGGGVGLVFLVLCANVGSLLLARLGARQQEFHMCSALGASRARLLREALIEHGLLGIGSVGLGVALAWGLVSLARAFLPIAFLVSTLHSIDLDPRALVVAVAAGLVATLAAGVLPAWMGTRPDRRSSFTSAGRGGTESRGARTLTRGLLVAELALACTLLVGATLLVRSFINLASVDPGLHVEGVLTTWVALPAKGFPDRPSRVAIAAALEDNIKQLPGVEKIALSTGLPPGGGATYFYDDWRGDGPDARPLHMVVRGYGVGPDFFELYGIPLLGGRTFQAGDGPDDVIVGERLAARLWPGQNPVGRTFHFNKERQGGHVIGLAREIRFPSLEAYRDQPEFYQPFELGGSNVDMNIRCQGRCPEEAVVRRQVLATVPGATIVRLGLLSDRYREELARPRGAAALGSTFALIAVLAAAGGLFSVLTYAVGRRRREFGIRTALGASPAQIRRLVLRDGSGVAALGVGVGILASAALARVISAVEYGVTGLDPVTWGLVLGVLAATTMLASWRPAHRAMRVDPVALLREE